MKFKLKQINLDEAVSNQQYANQIVQNSFQSMNNLRSDISEYWQSLDFSDSKKAVNSVNQINDATLRIIGLISNFEEMRRDYEKFVSSGQQVYFDDMIVDETYFKDVLNEINKRLPDRKITDLDIQYSDDDWSDFQ